jgi:hypothetical protein
MVLMWCLLYRDIICLGVSDELGPCHQLEACEASLLTLYLYVFIFSFLVKSVSANKEREGEGWTSSWAKRKPFVFGGFSHVIV